MTAIRWQITGLFLMFTALLLFGCTPQQKPSSSENRAAAASTPAPENIVSSSTPTATTIAPSPSPTATSIPPTATAIPCPLLEPVSSIHSNLTPFQAVLMHKVSFQLATYIVPKSPNDTFLVAFFQGFQDAGISKEEMDWILRDDKCNEIDPIGFGVPVPAEPVVMMGTLSSGNIYPVSDGEDPLLALIFVVPSEQSTITLLDPQRQDHSLTVSTEWEPASEHLLDNLETDGRIDWVTGGGDTWKEE